MASSSITSEPVADGVAITPGATVLTKPIRGFHVGVGGDVEIITLKGTTLVFEACIAGLYYPYSATHVLSANTTASSIIGLY